MNDATVRGIVSVIEETKAYGQNGFRKRLVVLEQDKGSFTNYVPVDFLKDGCDTVDGMKVGNDVEITYRLSGRKWQRDPDSEVKYFLNAEALSYRIVDEKEAAHSEGANNQLAEAALEDGDIPF